MAALIKKLSGIRVRLLLVSGFLLIIPWLGYQYILEMEEYLSRAQEQTVLGTARALATALSERPELFNDSSYSRATEGRDLYVYPVFYPLAIDDGNLLDWRDYQQYEQHYQEGSDSPNPANSLTSFRTGGLVGDPLSFRLMLGEYNRSLYAYLRVIDENVVLRSQESLRVDRSDSLRLAVVSGDGVFERYVIAPYDDEFIYPYRISNDITDVSALQYEPRITGRWTRTAEGYEVELRLPLEMLGNKLGISVFDVDDMQQRSVAAIVSTSGINNAEALGTLRRPTPEIDRIVAAMGLSNSRVQVVDRSQRVLLSEGDIQNASGLVLDNSEQQNQGGLWNGIRNSLLRPIYDQLLSQPTSSFVDELYQGGTLEGDHIISALRGVPNTTFRTLEDSQTRILAAAFPIMDNGQVLGAVVVDQNMNGIRTFRNQALEVLFDTMLGIMLLVVTVLFLFASGLSSRIRSLRNQAEQIIDDSGRINNTIQPSRSSDEIGDLSRSFANILDRLTQYTHYLENMSSRLSHELRTPVTVVRSSIENLRMAGNPEEAEVYIQRAEEGISRLNLILTNMSEASRLEQILKSSEKEKFDLTKVISGCVDGYSQIYPGVTFKADISDEPVVIEGNADYIVQLMDKLVANAVEFSYEDKAIRIKCASEDNEAVISVANSGPYLAEEMKDRIFDSMVSVRPESKKKQPHLGMGLHIVRMITDFHGGYVYADNLLEEEGVIVVLRIPLMV
ncbi:MAG: proteobacterial dedicated sortase system histidine kinase [Gammaproteobacteria bacterium]|nr:proteobacterial dedicated sortase system histidine kinase [Gammaproteobacteria bacterium]MAY03144.1 proteobacterial dedicated sortase system histidine kinase [Gammaproteobacteria bacterium]|tara:strand:- start:176666 stop:178861 length:2196 start_codon:yes stop_codon:yes gene_type:complete